MLVDTPGLRRTEDPVERAAIERSGKEVERADLVVLVLDATRPREPGQHALETEYPSAVQVLNKIDRAERWDLVGDVVRTVATTGEGVGELRAAIRRHFLGAEPFDQERPRPWTERQRQILDRAATDPAALSEL